MDNYITEPLPSQAEIAVQIEYHADDYGLFPAQSRRILRCREKGRLNGISVMPNGEDLRGSMTMLRQLHQDISVTIHLNLMEGKCLAEPGHIPDLVDTQGNLNCSFGSLLLRSFLPGRKALRRQLKEELRSQILAVRLYLKEGTSVRLDGHAHYHMIPVVFDALMDVIQEDALPVSYVRIPKEHWMVYLRHWRQIRDLKPINLVKVLVLNCLALRSRLRYGDYLATLDQKLFMGVLFSGRMLRRNVEPFLEEACRIAKQKNMGLEILAHPGGVYEPEDQKKLTNSNDFAFLTSPLRDQEASLFLENESETHSVLSGQRTGRHQYE